MITYATQTGIIHEWMCSAPFVQNANGAKHCFVGHENKIAVKLGQQHVHSSACWLKLVCIPRLKYVIYFIKLIN